MNSIDKDEYPQTRRDRAALREHGRQPLARRPGHHRRSAIGSSEAVMLAGHGDEVELARADAQGRRVRRLDKPEPGDEQHRAGGVGEVLPVLGGRAALRARSSAIGSS